MGRTPLVSARAYHRQTHVTLCCLKLYWGHRLSNSIMRRSLQSRHNGVARHRYEGRDKHAAIARW